MKQIKFQTLSDIIEHYNIKLNSKFKVEPTKAILKELILNLKYSEL